MKLAVALAALLSCHPSSACSDGPDVPTQFVGHWASSAGSCASDADDLVLRIGAKRISHWEGEGPIRAAVSRGHNELALIAELSDEGETWLATYRFELSDDGQRLIDSTTVPGQPVVRYKCPAVAARRPG